MAEIHSHTLRVEDLDLHYLEAGAGPPVLLLHGWPTHAQLWRHALPLIGEHRRAIALDLPGFGASEKSLNPSYSFRFYDRLLTGFLDALGIDSVGLVVHDLGGPIGLHWVANNRSRVTDLVLLNTLAFPEMSFAVKAFVAASFIPGARRVLSSRWGLGAAMRFGVTDKARIDDEVAAIYQDPFVSPTDRKALLKTAHSLHMGGFHTIEASLSDHKMPVKLLYGEDDRILPNVGKTMARVKQHIPHAQLDSIPNCGHFLQEDRPLEVAKRLEDFLSTSLHA